MLLFPRAQDEIGAAKQLEAHASRFLGVSVRSHGLRHASFHVSVKN
jgi:hypothetical protein